MSKIRAIVKRTDEQYGHVTNISSTLKNLQKIVEGPIETVKVTDDTVLVCNEEGKIQGLPKNFIMGQVPFHDVIVGDVVIVGADGEDFCDCPLDFATWKWLLKSWGTDMAGLRNKHADMEIGYVNIGTQKKLYVQVGHERQYYGTLMSAKADKFLRMLEKWDEAGGGDE